VILNQNTSISLELQSGIIEGPTVIIQGEKSKNTESTEMGRASFEVETIKKLPALLGEVDILKTIQYLPGIQAAGEGNSGFYVRGGGPDQNLILLDNATIYNASHLFGFFSVFNADAVKSVEVIKGGMPAEYGGRVSSVLDITLKEGNKKEYVFEGGIG
jgi:outer membrane receptor for ferrienterochelin and colicin